MSLISNVQSRYSEQILINASNPQNSTATTIDTGRLTLACTDVEGEFLKRGITYNDDDKRHVSTACPGALARLVLITHGGGKEDWNDFKDDLKLLAESTSRDRITPYTNSPLDPTPDTTGTLPFGDNTNFDRFVPSNNGENPEGQN